ncbi:MAG: hypothetical protein A4E57_00991 [Syntrophorhabdaceae bacterium PtaU1.Bin034]|nr:MAG: hypothetical protein A4E57_00991 [Syntrophorhabdaceae bacterium PtaU1.Bin034]
MKRKGSALVQSKEGWYGVTFDVREKEISELRVHSGKSLPELKQLVGEKGYGVALENGYGYLFNLSFPFSDKRKIRMVIGNELEERLPLSTEDISVDFVETTRGGVLAAAVPNTVLEEFRTDKHTSITTLQSLSVLYALKWFGVIHKKDFAFIHVNGNSTVIMGFKEDNVCYIRQFFHLPQSDGLTDAVREMLNNKDFNPLSWIMISDSEDAASLKEEIEKTFHLHIDTPRLGRLLHNGEAPEWLWPGIGAALLSIKPKGEINLTGLRQQYAFLSTKAGLRISAALAALGLFVLGLFYLDYYFKERTYRYLSSEPMRIYKLAFPKSPPVKDTVKAFRDKIKALEAEPGSIGAANNPLAVLDQISSKIPADLDVKVHEFVSDEKEFTISGTTVSFASVEKIKVGIEQMKGVSQVDMQNLELAANKQVKFRLRGRL